MFVFVCCVHPISSSVSISLAGICCSAVWSRNCFPAFLLVYISRFRFLIRFRLHVKFCSFVLTKVTLSLNLIGLDISSAVQAMKTIWMSESVKLLSINVRGLGNFKKRRAIFTWCRKAGFH